MSRTATVTPIKPLQIETGVPMPGRCEGAVRGDGTRAALRALAVAPIGASVLFPSSLGLSHSALSARMQGVAGSGWASARKTPDGIRVWKIAEPRRR